ncbi:MAG: hypothetical protein Q4C65_08465 [Eubacteriales bacterium]|nr:hypothetical protein [Eubacteriales bacterium]
MLKKLLKYELKQTWRISVLILAVTFLLSAACSLYFYMTPPLTAEGEIHIGNFTLFMAYVIIVSFVALLTFVYLGVHFYRNLYTDEGYLMHTLPVRPWQLIASKAVVGTIWYYLAGIIASAGIIAVSYLAIPRIVYVSPKDYVDAARLSAEMTGLFSGVWGLKLFLFLGPYTIISCAYALLVLYASVSLGQLVGRHKVMVSILCYLGLQTLIGGASTLFLMPALSKLVFLSDSDAVSLFSDFMTGIYTGSFVFFLAAGAGLFFLSDYIMRRCLNLD